MNNWSVKPKLMGHAKFNWRLIGGLIGLAAIDFFIKKGNTMKRLSIFFATVALSSMLQLANAGEFDDLRSKFSEARTSLVTMIFYEDQRGAKQQKLVKATADAVSARLAKMKAPVGKEGSFKELVETWNDFKETREKELVPALLRGDDELARKLVWGIQKTRYTKCLALIRELDDQKISAKVYGSGFLELGLRLSEARISLLNMMRSPNKRGAEQQKLVQDTADAVSVKLADMRAPVGKEAEFKELVETWNAFKQTREKELVPAILKNNDAEAAKIANGIQQERLTRILALNKELNNYSLVPPTIEGGIEEFRDKLNAARDSLLVMLRNKDKRGADQQKLVKDTADAVSEEIKKIRAPVGKEAHLNQLIENWNAFKETREKELVPAILEGREIEATRMVKGIQNQRLMKCLALAGSMVQ
jgi:hypothetical protein